MGTLAKHAGGRPLAFKTPEELDEKIQEYFTYCDNGFREVVDKETGESKLVAYRTPYTMTGLALALGVDRQTLLNYQKRDKFLPIIKRAKMKVTQSVEERLLSSTGVVAGQIFWLKNNDSGWNDKQEVEINDKKHVTVQILERYGLKPGEEVIDLGEIESLKKIASGQ